MTADPTRTHSYNLGDLLELVAASVPDRVAVVAGDVRYTFAEFDRRTNQVARMLLDQGLEPGAKVAIYSWNRAEWAELFFGCFKARVVPINVNYRYVAHELRYVLENSDAEVVVFERGFADVMAEVAPELPALRATLVIEDGSSGDVGDARSYEEAVTAASPEPFDNGRSGDDLYFLYTGGTTGMPKGVMWRHEDLFFAALSSGLGPEPISSPEEITQRSLPEEFARPSLIIAPLMHGAAQWGMCNMLYAGAGVVLYTGHGLDPHEVWSLAEREHCMGITLVGDAMARPLADALADGTRSYDLSGLFRIGSGGGVFSPAVQGQLKELIPHVRCGRQLRRLRDRRRRHERRGRRPPVRREPRAQRARRASSGRSGPARSACSPAAGTSRSATTRTRPRPRRPSRPTPTACAGRSPATTPPSTTTAWSRCSAGARSASTPAARRSTPRRSRRRSRATPTCSTPSWSACPTSAGASGWPRWSSPGRAPRPTLEDLSRALPAHPRRLQGPPPGHLRGADQAVTGRQGRLPLGQGPGDAGGGGVTVDLGLSADQESIQELFDGFFANESPPEVARAAEPLGFDRSLWARSCELGAPGMGVAESAGGGGAGLADLVVVAESLGRAIAPVPLVEHLVAARAAARCRRGGRRGARRPCRCDPPTPTAAGGCAPAGAVADVVIGVDGDELVAVRSTPPGDGPRNHGRRPARRPVRPRRRP